MFILLNGSSDSLILFKFWNISHFLGGLSLHLNHLIP